MPNTYKKLEQYALNPQLIPENDAGILILTCQLTSEPEFSKEQLYAYMKLMQKDNISLQDLATDAIVQSCMKQGGFKSIEEYIASDKKLGNMIQENSNLQTEVNSQGSIQNRIETLKKRLPYSSPVSKVKTINELRGIRSNETSKPIKQTTINVAALKQKITQNEG
jgi:hypothetical protein